MERHRLFEELEACDPKYQQHYGTLRAAAEHCGVLPEYHDYLRSSDGQKYATAVVTAPDVLSETRAARAAAEALPYTLDNIGTVPHVAGD